MRNYVNYSLHIIIFCMLMFLSANLSHGQSIWANPITDPNPSVFNPFVLGQTFDPNITVSGIGRGPTVLANAGLDRYNANSWNLATTDPGDYFSWTLTPNSMYEINFVSLVFKAQVSSTGPTTFSLRSSIDGFFGDIANPVIPNSAIEEGPFTVSLTAPIFQNITSPITFRIYGCCGGNAAGTFSINEFSFNGTVDPICTPPSLSTSSTNVSCFGGNNGSIDLTTTGGSAPFTYSWTGPSSFSATTEDITGLSAGTYVATITATGGCTATTSVDITQPAGALTANISTSTNVSCNGGSNGSATVVASGGTAGYTYSWSPSGGTGATASGLTANSYTVTVTDANGCTATASTNITQPTPLNLSSTHVDVLCNGANTGSIDLTVTGGTTLYTYGWSNGATTQDISSLVAGPYGVTVTDANGCTATTSVSITQPPALNLTTIITNITCNGANDGSIDLTVAGGNPSYSYLWSNGATSQDISSLGVGTYTVTVTDANSCTASLSASITTPAVINLSAIPTNISCNGANNGSIDLTVSGGTPTYTYVWSNGANTQDISSLGVGVYLVTVTDANGCTASISTPVSEPAVLSLTTTQINVNCGGANTGSIDLTVSGGTPIYSYAWSNGATSQDIASLPVGTYSVIVTDAHGCTATTSATITSPPALNLSNTHVNVTPCFGGNNGSIDLTVTGGTPSYTYLWSNSATTQDISSLTGGNYNVTVTDANGCTVTTTVNISQPPLISLTSTHINPGCSGGLNNGSIDLTVSGGTPGYTYLWSNSATTQDISSLGNGTYTVTVTDASGCTNTSSVFLTSSANLILNSTWTNASCSGGANGSIDLTVSSGTPSYTYVWSNGATTQDISSLTAGTYTVTVSDAGGCTGTFSQVITEAGQIVSDVSITTCGSYTSPSGNYTWYVSGLYADTIAAVNGCDSLIGIDLTIQTPNTVVMSTGATLIATLPGATYQWLDCNNGMSPVPGANSQYFTPGVVGNFAVIVNQGGCFDTSDCYPTFNLSLIPNDLNIEALLYPNPNNGNFNLLVSGLTNDDLFVEILDIGGKIWFQRLYFASNGTIQIPFENLELNQGIYLMRLFSGGHYTVKRFIKSE